MITYRRLLFLLIIGGGGLATLLSLAFWQVDRLTWKRELNAEIAARSDAKPLQVTGRETLDQDDHRAARATGRYLDEPSQIRYLTSIKGFGPGFRLIAPFELENGERILIDRGFAPESAAPRGGPAPAPPASARSVAGVLRWPNEASAFTPEPNLQDRIWFARDVIAMAEALGARPVMLVQAPPTAAPAGNVEWPAPIFEKVALPNNHFGYAVTWFSLAAIWAAMTALWVFRTRSESERRR